MLHGLMGQMVQWSIDLVDYMGYPGIVVLMGLESSLFPWPSELVMPQAGYLAAEGKMNMAVVITLGVVGSWVGALFNYALAMWLGRPFFLRYGKNFFCPPDKFAMVERFFAKHGEISTFTGRLIPVVRHLISIPAGLTRMKMSHFLFYTGLGAGIWVTILSYVGFICGRNIELIKRHSRDCTIAVIVACVAIVAVYIWLHRRRQARYGATADQK